MSLQNMNFSNASIRPAARRAAMIALGCALGLVFFQIPTIKAADSVALRPLDDKLPDLPLTGSFDKADGDNGPYVLNLKNTSGDSIRASGTVYLSVASHGDKKSRDIPEHVVARGEVWTLTGLAAGDKVTISAAGYAPLELTAP
jgi:hypothetical protein